MQDNMLEIGYSWDTGLARDINEDSMLYTSFNIRTHLGISAGGLFAVADGMGGHSAGEIASDLAIKTVQANCMYNLFTRRSVPPLAILASAFEEANNRIIDASRENGLGGMGTTLTAALIIGGDMYLAHIGDSRCYVINARETIRLTRDHSVVQEMVDSGAITADEAREHPRRNLITRVMGHTGDTVPDLHQVKLFAGDNILLCSDGLHGVVPDAAIADTVMNSADASRACAALTEQAMWAGGPDNISVIIVRPGNLPSWQAVTAAETGIRRISQEL
jgi:protein phosphatase